MYCRAGQKRRVSPPNPPLSVLVQAKNIYVDAIDFSISISAGDRHTTRDFNLYDDTDRDSHCPIRTIVTMDESTMYNDSKNPLLLNLTSQTSPGDVSPLEQDVLDEYERLLKNMKTVSLASLVALPQSRRNVNLGPFDAAPG